MQKEIRYSGYSASPSDYESPDGELATAVNVIPEDGMVKPILPPVTLLTLGTGKKVPFVHHTSAFTHYIVEDDATDGQHSFYYIDKDDGTKELKSITADGKAVFTTADDILQLNAIGNVLLIITSSGTHYFLWKAADYCHLGTHLPELRMQFGLQYDVVQSDQFEVKFDGHLLMYDSSKYGSAFYNKFSDDTTYGSANETYVSQCVKGQANKFINEKGNKKGRFVYPFFVRYAYRLYDGSHTMPSAPILMYCADGCTPLPLVTGEHYDGNGNTSRGFYDKWYIKITAPVFDLLYMAQASDIKEIKEWGDIITGVDVFISKPIYTYDQNGTITNNIPYTECNFNFVGKKIGESEYKKHTSDDMLAAIAKANDNESAILTMKSLTPLPAKSTDAIKAEIEDTSQFYLLKSFKVEDLATSLTKIDVKEDYLQSLVNREVLSDDYDSHDTLVASRSFVYNSRLNLTGITKTPFGGFESCSMGTYMTNPTHTIKDIYVYIKQDGQDIIVKNTGKYNSGSDILYFYYPNANAYQAVVTTSVGNKLLYKLSAHPLLNGAYWFNSFKLPDYTTIAPVATESPKIRLQNKIYTSDVNNPFHFPTLGIYTVGAGNVMGISTAAKALSQGQFGQFPLYAFTDEGVWALEVNTSTGTYSARQPITRDVCINADSITQIDSAVLFATARGIMLLSGSTSICISDILNSRTAFNPLEMANGDKLVTLSSLDKENVETVPFMTFLQKCGMIYDYPHQRIIVYNPEYKYAYVYSLKDKKWGMTVSSIAESVSFYPEAYAMDNAGNLINYSTDDASSTTIINGLIFTRPLKLDMPDVLKTVDTIIQRGYFQRDHVAQVLYGSRDLFHWHAVWSSSDKYLRGFAGTPYKYFVIAIVCSLNVKESLSGCTVQYYPRLTNQPR